MKTYKGSLRISLPTNGRDEEEFFEIAVTDESSHIEFLRVRISAADLSKAIACRQAEVTFKTRGMDRIGWIAENKTEDVPVPEKLAHSRLNEAQMRKILEPFEVDGWVARQGDIGNGHCRTKTGYRVVFFRHVPPTEEDSE